MKTYQKIACLLLTISPVTVFASTTVSLEKAEVMSIPLNKPSVNAYINSLNAQFFPEPNAQVNSTFAKSIITNLSTYAVIQNHTLIPTSVIYSPNRASKLVMQNDGNLVMYLNNRAIWSTRTAGRQGVRAVMQTDGNFVVYQNTTPIWTSNTYDRYGAYLRLHNAGKLDIVQNNIVLWAN